MSDGLELFRRISETYSVSVPSEPKSMEDAIALNKDLLEYLKAFLADTMARDDDLSTRVFNALAKDDIARQVMRTVFAAFQACAFANDIHGLDYDNVGERDEGVTKLQKLFTIFITVCAAVSCEVLLQDREEKRE